MWEGSGQKDRYQHLVSRLLCTSPNNKQTNVLALFALLIEWTLQHLVKWLVNTVRWCECVFVHLHRFVLAQLLQSWKGPLFLMFLIKFILSQQLSALAQDRSNQTPSLFYSKTIRPITTTTPTVLMTSWCTDGMSFFSSFSNTYLPTPPPYAYTHTCIHGYAFLLSPLAGRPTMSEVEWTIVSSSSQLGGGAHDSW